MKLIYRGAEADVFRGEWCEDPAIYKVRKPLRYRLPELDKLIRSQRTIREAQMIHLSKLAGVSAPHLYYMSPSEALLIMEYLEGKRLKTVLQEAKGGGEEIVGAIAAELGKDIARLHAAGIMHGDLTTSNVIINEAGRISLIDFGLAVHSQRLEDHAVDLRLIKETVVGAHNPVSGRFMQSLLEGYGSVLGRKKGAEAIRKLAEIERRGRYARVE